MVDFGTMVDQLNQLGFYNFILPFLLIFLVVYAINEKTKFLPGTAGALLSLLVALFSTYYLASTSVGPTLSFFLGKLGVVLILILVVLIVKAFASGEK